MKNPLRGLLLTCLLVFAWDVSGLAQETKPDPQAADQAAGQQTPPQQTPPAQTPQQQTPPQQTPPSEATQMQRGKVPEPPPPPPKVPDVRRPGESGYYVGLIGWFPTEQAVFDRGRGSTFIGSSRITIPGKPHGAEGVEFGVAAGLHNALRFTYFQVKTQGNVTVPTDLVAWAQVYPAGTYVASRYQMRNFKLSYEFLTWPYPVGSRKFRLKTLWQLQYTGVNTSFDAPKNYYDTAGNLLIDPNSGNPISLVGAGTKYFVLPTFGLGAHYYSTRHLRFEANASGFALPHHTTLWDADATLNLRMIGHLELRLGAKAFHFKTSTQGDFYQRGTMASAFVGLRWYSLSE